MRVRKLAPVRGGMWAGGIKLFVVIIEHTKMKLSQGLKSRKMSSACLICVDYKRFIFVLACVDLKVRKTHTHAANI